jgi:hypothetical protein
MQGIEDVAQVGALFTFFVGFSQLVELAASPRLRQVEH